MARPERTRPIHEAPPLDPYAVDREYRRHRARREARIKHKQQTRRAHVRFWLVLLLLAAGLVALTVVVWHEIQHLFGL
jgi:hypothetical protein